MILEKLTASKAIKPWKPTLLLNAESVWKAIAVLPLAGRGLCGEHGPTPRSSRHRSLRSRLRPLEVSQSASRLFHPHARRQPHLVMRHRLTRTLHTAVLFVGE